MNRENVFRVITRYFQSQSKMVLSDLVLANVEALVDDEVMGNKQFIH